MNSTQFRRTRQHPALNIPEDVAFSLTRQLLIDPFTEKTGPELSLLSKEETHALESLATEIGTSVNDLMNSPVLVQKAIELLAKLMRQSILTESRTKAARESLGEEGLLNPSEYSIELGELIKTFERFGERPANIEQVIHFPDVVQHLTLPGLKNIENKECLSFFIREIKPRKRNSFLQMVIARRNGSNLKFCAAWRFYRELVSWDATMSPIDLFKKFVDRYGIPFSVGNNEPTKFILEKEIELTEGANRSVNIKIDSSKLQNAQHNFMQLTVINEIENKKQFISIAYVIDPLIYKAETSKVG